MKKFTFGTPEKLVPSYFCKNFNYTETDIKYPESNFSFHTLKSGKSFKAILSISYCSDLNREAFSANVLLISIVLVSNLIFIFSSPII